MCGWSNDCLWRIQESDCLASYSKPWPIIMNIYKEKNDAMCWVSSTMWCEPVELFQWKQDWACRRWSSLVPCRCDICMMLCTCLFCWISRYNILAILTSFVFIMLAAAVPLTSFLCLENKMEDNCCVLSHAQSYELLSVFQCLGDRNGIRPVKTLHQNPLALVVDISGCSTGCCALWQTHLPVNATEGATCLPRFTWKIGC